MSKLIYDETEGYNFISDNGIRYDLLEGMSLNGKSTSDIVYIHLNYDEDLFEDVIYLHDEIDEFVGWFYGASMITEPEYHDEYREEYMEYINQLVNAYEEKHPEIVEYFNSKKEMKEEE